MLAYWLTGKKAVERTVASTSQLLDARTGDWAWGVIEALGLPKKISFRDRIQLSPMFTPESVGIGIGWEN